MVDRVQQAIRGHNGAPSSRLKPAAATAAARASRDDRRQQAKPGGADQRARHSSYHGRAEGVRRRRRRGTHRRTARHGDQPHSECGRESGVPGSAAVGAGGWVDAEAVAASHGAHRRRSLMGDAPPKTAPQTVADHRLARSGTVCPLRKTPCAATLRLRAWLVTTDAAAGERRMWHAPKVPGKAPAGGLQYVPSMMGLARRIRTHKRGGIPTGGGLARFPRALATLPSTGNTGVTAGWARPHGLCARRDAPAVGPTPHRRPLSRPQYGVRSPPPWTAVRWFILAPTAPPW